MADPHVGMVSFQQAINSEILVLAPVRGHKDLFSYVDTPAPGVNRLTYARLNEDHKTVNSFVSCVMNGYIDDDRCIAVGYAVPQNERNKGRAKQILREVIEDLVLQAGRNGAETVYIEAVVDITNIPSQKVAEAVLNVEKENITDSASGRPAYRYTARYETTQNR